MRFRIHKYVFLCFLVLTLVSQSARADEAAEYQPGMVRCANLVYADGKTSVCFSDEFLKRVTNETHAQVEAKLHPVKVESQELYQFPFAVMTGEGSFTLTSEQRESLRNYLLSGGFVIASAGCSSPPWAESFRSEIRQAFPDAELKRLEADHPVFHTVYKIDRLDCKRGANQGYLEGLEIDGKIVLIFSADGLNDTSKVGGKCCCCGGNEIRNAREINVNLFVYALTH